MHDLFLKENKNENLNINAINKIFIRIKDKKDSSFLEIKKLIEEKIVNSFIKYRKEVNMEKDYNMIVTPPTLNNIILYYYCFFKQIISGKNLNLFNSIFNESIKNFLKNIFPNILNLKYLNDIKKEKIYIHPSTIYNLYKNQLLLIDNGQYIKILINENINKEILYHFLPNFDSKEKNELNDNEFYYENNYLKDILLSKPIRFIFINEKIIY